jgi:MoxR-like ATPase
MSELKSKTIIDNIMNEVKKVIVGKDEVLKQVIVGIIGNGNILFEDVPGLGKTMMVRAFAQAMGLSFKRIQFTPDLLPADITGLSVYNMQTQEFVFKKGPIFCNLLLADEINRATPKTQSALLESMQEKTVTVDGDTKKLDLPFIVLATQNPLEYEGTFALPEAQLDRFLLKLDIGYPEPEDEVQILKNRITRRSESFQLNQVATIEDILKLQQEVEKVHVDEAIMQYIVKLINETRKHNQISVGASPRGSLGLIIASRAWALLQGRDYVNPQDIQDIFISVIRHRLILRSSDLMSGVSVESILSDIISKVVAPRLE